jgi:hypothetical protein
MATRQPIILTEEIVPPPALIRAGLEALPSIIRNRNTRMAYARAVKQFFDWCDKRKLELGAGDSKGRLFRSMHKGDKLMGTAMTRFDVFQMIKRRAKAAALPYSTAATRSEPPGSPPICRTAGRSSTPKLLRTTNRPGRPSFTTVPGRSFLSMRSKK